jgi:hypothetical protein
MYEDLGWGTVIILRLIGGARLGSFANLSIVYLFMQAFYNAAWAVGNDVGKWLSFRRF